jgi:aspartate kinase
MLDAHGFLRRLFEVFERHQTPVDVITTSEVSVSMTIDDRRRLAPIVEDLSRFAEVAVEEHQALVCVVGDGLPRDPRTFGRIVTALDDIPLKLVSQAASRRNVTLVLAGEDLPEALRRLHEEFFADAVTIGEGPARVARADPGRQ